MRTAPPPDIEDLPPRVARALCAVATQALDTALNAELSLPSPLAMQWADRTIDCRDAFWTLEAGQLRLVLSTSAGDDSLDDLDAMNVPVEVSLDGGGTVASRFARRVSESTYVSVEKKIARATHTVALDSWTWWPPKHDCFWVAMLEDLYVDDGNLVWQRGDDWDAGNLFLCGAYDLYVLGERKKRRSRLLVNTRGERFDHGVFGLDFLAMEFSLGHPLRLSHLLAVDENGVVVGAAGLDFGVVGTNATSRGPTATASDLYANYGDASRLYEHTWSPILFSLIANRLREEGPDSLLLVGVGGYLDSIAARNIHVSYLLAQVALEAICSEIVRPASGVLVASTEKWLEFVGDHEQDIRNLAASSEFARLLVEKVKSAQQAPSSGRVAAAFAHFKLELPGSALKEVVGRNRAAHSYLMAQESSADVQQLADRVATIQTLLAAIVAKYVDFQGPIVGWEWVKGRNRIPDWWKWDRDRIRKRYMARVEATEQRP